MHEIETDIVRREDSHYRKGVVLGLTMAEVTIILIFCLLLTMLYALHMRDKKLERLKNLERNTAEFAAPRSLLNTLERKYGRVTSQEKLNDDFQKLSADIEIADQAMEKLEDIDIGTPTFLDEVENPSPAQLPRPKHGLPSAVKTRHTNPDHYRSMVREDHRDRTPPGDTSSSRRKTYGENINVNNKRVEPSRSTGMLTTARRIDSFFGPPSQPNGLVQSIKDDRKEASSKTTKYVGSSRDASHPRVTWDAQDKLKWIEEIINSAKDAVVQSGHAIRTPADIKAGLEDLKYISSRIKEAGLTETNSTRQSSHDLNVKFAGVLCAENYSDPKFRAKCIRKIVNVIGGSGLEFQSCWWDKSTVPWKTKRIYDVILTDYGFIIQDIDPGTAEYRKQKAQVLPLGKIRINSEISEEAFIAQTKALHEWSVNNKCRFYVRVIDATGPTSKSIYKRRLEKVEEHFYKELFRGKYSGEL